MMKLPLALALGLLPLPALAEDFPEDPTLDRGSFYEQLGLQNGDIIRSIDGETVTDPSQAAELISRITESAPPELAVEEAAEEPQPSEEPPVE
jgi:hypothetical protein